MAHDAERVAGRVLKQHATEVERIKSVLVSCINRLKGMDCQGWRKEGNDLVNWMQGEANDMANAEKDVAITKATGGSASILGGVMTGMGIVGSFFTFGLAAPLAVAGLAVAGAGAATSAGGDIAKLSIVHMKTCELKKRCQSFEQRSEGIVAALVQLRAVMTELSELCKKQKMLANDSAVGVSVIDSVLKSGKTATNLVTAGVNTYKVAAIVFDIAVLQRSGVIFGGADFLRVVAGLARRCIVQVSYEIGVLEPLSVFVDTYGTGTIPDAKILEIIKQNFDFYPGMIAIMCGSSLRDSYHDIECWSYLKPACLSLKLAVESAKFATSFVSAYDVVSRFLVAKIQGLQKQLKEFDCVAEQDGDAG